MASGGREVHDAFGSIAPGKYANFTILEDDPFAVAPDAISDVVMGIMANPFYVDMGYTKDEVAAVTKVFGVIMTLVGAFVGRLVSTFGLRFLRGSVGR